MDPKNQQQCDADDKREPYVRPELRLIGDVVELTQGAGSRNLDVNETLTLP